MKKLSCILITGLLLLGSSCSSGQRNELKLKASDLIAKEFKQLEDKEFAKEEYAGMSCEYESTLLSMKLRDKVDEILKVEREQSPMVKSIGGEIAKSACEFLIEKALSSFVQSKFDEYPCSQKFLGSNFEKLSDKVCPLVKEKIDGGKS